MEKTELNKLVSGDRVAFEYLGEQRIGRIRKVEHKATVTWYWVDGFKKHPWEVKADLIFYLSESQIIKK
ncbi:MAG: hypothetical protein ACXABY_13150 [Candidatus Thorarchaeota archaeon]|jgi:hypothetical protein